MLEPAPPPPARWTEVLALVPRGWEELVAEALATDAFASVAYGPPSLATEPAPAGLAWLRAYLPAERDTPAERARLEAAVAALPEATGCAELAEVRLRFRPLPPEDFARSWRRAWRPLRVGRLALVPLDHAPALRPGDVALRFEPGGAFGTGRHATTRACLAALQELLAPGERVLDAGTGSGLLAVAAALLGAGEAVGFDVDPRAGVEAAALARANGVAARCRFLAAGFEALGEAPGPYDGVLANLYADLHAAHAGDLAGALRPGGWACLSGIRGDRLPAVLDAVHAAGLAPRDVRARGRWRTIVAKRGPA